MPSQIEKRPPKRTHNIGQWGTHVDPTAHFIKGLRTVDQIDLKEMILPLVVIDVHAECAKNADYTLPLERVKKLEMDHGQIPVGAFVAMRTDWSKRWPDAAKMENKDANGTARYPGWTLPALKYLYEERRITASGHETTDTDPGLATTKDDYSLETYISEHEPLSDRAAHEPGPINRSRRNRRCQFPQTKRRLRFPGARICNSAIAVEEEEVGTSRF